MAINAAPSYHPPSALLMRLELENPENSPLFRGEVLLLDSLKEDNTGGCYALPILFLLSFFNIWVIFME